MKETRIFFISLKKFGKEQKKHTFAQLKSQLPPILNRNYWPSVVCQWKFKTLVCNPVSLFFSWYWIENQLIPAFRDKQSSATKVCLIRLVGRVRVKGRWTRDKCANHVFNYEQRIKGKELKRQMQELYREKKITIVANMLRQKVLEFNDYGSQLSRRYRA